MWTVIPPPHPSTAVSPTYTQGYPQRLWIAATPATRPVHSTIHMVIHRVMHKLWMLGTRERHMKSGGGHGCTFRLDGLGAVAIVSSNR